MRKQHTIELGDQVRKVQRAYEGEMPDVLG